MAKFTPEHVMKAQRGSRGKAVLLSSTWALDGVGGQRHAVPIYRRLGGLQGRSGRARKMSSLPGFDPWTVQSTGVGRIPLSGNLYQTVVVVVMI